MSVKGKVSASLQPSGEICAGSIRKKAALFRNSFSYETVSVSDNALYANKIPIKNAKENGKSELCFRPLYNHEKEIRNQEKNP
jgi:glutaredoxin